VERVRVPRPEALLVVGEQPVRTAAEIENPEVQVLGALRTPAMAASNATQ
jgi:hypothetical protein